MVSITNQPFPVARGEDGIRVARAFAESKNPTPGSAGHRLLKAYRKRCKSKADNQKEGRMITDGY